MTSLIRTDRSTLLAHPLDQEWLERIPTLAAELDPHLIVHPETMLYGKRCTFHRSIGFFSDTSTGYKYSGQLAAAQPLTPSLREILTYINDRFNSSFNGILINKYDGGEEYISKHSDDESALDPHVGVMVISVGSVRKFRIRDKITGEIVLDTPTAPDMILNMKGDFQKEFTHEIPIEKRVEGVRYSFTFRRHLS